MDYKLREWSITDLKSLARHANNKNIARFMMDQFPHPYSEENARAFIEMANKNEPANIMAIEVNDEAVGGIGLHLQHDVYRKNAELGYWLAEPFWGNGIISSAVRQMVDYGFQNFEIERIFARPFGTNKASQRVLEKAGFTLEARLERTIFKDGEFLDELVFGVRRLK